MKKFLIKYAEIRNVEDSYSQGEQPDTETSYDRKDLHGKTFADLRQLGILLNEDLTKENTISFDDRILIQQIVDEQECTLTADEMKRWKDGNFKAFARTIDIKVTLIEEQDTTEEETAKLLNIQAYG